MSTVPNSASVLARRSPAGLWWFTGFHFDLSQFDMPPVLPFLLEALLLVWVMERYDVLTVFAAVATAVLWVVNYPLSVIFSNLGNGAYLAVFVGWGAVVLAAALAGFGPKLKQVFRSARQEFQ